MPWSALTNHYRPKSTHMEIELPRRRGHTGDTEREILGYLRGTYVRLSSIYDEIDEIIFAFEDGLAGLDEKLTERGV